MGIAMLNPIAVRKQFPSLQQTHNGRPVVFFDNPGGTQVPLKVIEAVAGYLRTDNANHGGAFPTSMRSDAMVEEARRAMADMLGAASPREIVFGPNMTTLTYGKADVMQALYAYKPRPAPDELPRKFETGTQNHEGIAGTGLWRICSA